MPLSSHSDNRILAGESLILTHRYVTGKGEGINNGCLVCFLFVAQPLNRLLLAKPSR